MMCIFNEIMIYNENDGKSHHSLSLFKGFVTRKEEIDLFLLRIHEKYCKPINNWPDFGKCILFAMC